MAYVKLKNCTVKFSLFGSASISLKKTIINMATGGKIENKSDTKTIHITAIDNLSIEFKNKDRIGLVGHNGSGKTTFLRLVAGIYKPSSGTVDTEGKISVLLDPNAGINPEATGLENIYLKGYILGLSKNEIDGKVEEIRNFSGLGDFLNLPVRTYSSGMLSRLGFAISTCVNPEILLIDEHIGTGDKEFTKKIQDKSLEFLDNAQISIFASHDLNFLKYIGANIIELKKGKIIRY